MEKNLALQLQVGAMMVAINNKPLEGKTVAPPLTIGAKYQLKEIILDKEGNPHLDVGIFSDYNFITSFETGEELQRGDSIHWCHPSRFELA